GPHFNFFLDTAPLREFLKHNVSWQQMEKNVHEGAVDAVTVTATNTRSGRSELFMLKKKGVRYTGYYGHDEGETQVEHVMSSAAIPIIFPTVKIGKSHYTDGGLRLFTPLS